MTDQTLCAGTAAAVTSLTLTVRGLMLKRAHCAWPYAPGPVRAVVLVCGAVFGGLALDLWRSPSANLRECVAYTTTALSGVALLINMWRQRQPDCGRPLRLSSRS